MADSAEDAALLGISPKRQCELAPVQLWKPLRGVVQSGSSMWSLTFPSGEPGEPPGVFSFKPLKA
jgi:hypothetical protein